MRTHFLKTCSLLGALALTFPEASITLDSPRIIPESGHVLIPAGPNSLDLQSNEILIPVSPDTFLNPATGRILFSPPEGDPDE